MARILVAESYTDAREMLVLALRGAGHVVEAVVRGTDLLAVASEWLPEAIVLDVALPTVDGLQALRILKQNPRMENVVLVVVTGYDQLRAAARRAGCDHFFLKPVDLTHLLEVIAETPAACMSPDADILLGNAACSTSRE
jgi:CheY-like chemotaxis protein